MTSLAELLLKKFFVGNGYYAKGFKREGDGKDEVVYAPVMTMPDAALLEKHLIGETIVGAYTLRQDNTVMWMAWDVDSSDLQKARDLTAKLSTYLERIPHAIESSGRKGYHVIIFFKKPVEAERARAIGDAIREAIGGRISGDPHIEVFPKQDQLTQSNPLGNLMKVPLGLHPITGNRSKFVSILDWEEGSGRDPVKVLTDTTTLEDLASVIVDYIDPIETVVEIMQSHWVSGERHDLSLFLAGALVNAGWEEEDALTVIEKLYDEMGGDLGNQLQAVTDTYKKFYSGDKVAGLLGLSDRLPSSTLLKLSDILQQGNVTPIKLQLDQIRLQKDALFLRTRSAMTTVINYLEDNGEVVLDSGSEELFWLDRKSYHLHSMENDWWKTLLYNTFGLSPTEAFGKHVSTEIYHTCRERGNKAKTYTRAFWDDDNLYLNLGTSYYYRLGGGEDYSQNGRWGHKTLNGENGIIFRTRQDKLHLDLDRAWEDGQRQQNPWEYLINDLNFGMGSTGVSPYQQKELLKAWILSTFFPNTMPTRPLLVIIADPGAGKTTAARRLLKVLEGPHSDVLGFIADKQDSLRASIGSHNYVVLDNLEKRKSQWLPDILNRLSTGTHEEIRKLFTTNETMTIIPDCFIMITATSLPFSEETLFTRMLPIELATISNPIPEYVMQKKVTDNLGGIWMGLMSYLDEVVLELKSVRTAQAPTQSRLADFSVFCNRLRGLETKNPNLLHGGDLIKGLEMMTNRQKILLHEASPFVQTLDVWLRDDREAGERQGKGPNGLEAPTWKTASDLNGILARVASKNHIQWEWDTGQSLSRHIKALEPHLIRNFGMQTTEATKHKPKFYRFSPEIIDMSSPTDDYYNIGTSEINLERGTND